RAFSLFPYPALFRSRIGRGFAAARALGVRFEASLVPVRMTSGRDAAPSTLEPPRAAADPAPPPTRSRLPPEHVDREAEVEALAVPIGSRGPGAGRDAAGAVALHEGGRGFVRQPGMRRQRRYDAPVGAPEPEAGFGRAVGQVQSRRVLNRVHGLDPDPTLVHPAVVEPAEQHEVLQGGLAAVGPVPDMMCVRMTHAAPREA